MTGRAGGQMQGRCDYLLRVPSDSTPPHPGRPHRHRARHLPDHRSAVVSQDLVMEAIVLAGGLGTRLRGVVDDVPKPMAPVLGRPFLAYVLDQLVDGGFDDRRPRCRLPSRSDPLVFWRGISRPRACLRPVETQAAGNRRGNTVGLRSGPFERRIRVEWRYLPGTRLPRHAEGARARGAQLQPGRFAKCPTSPRYGALEVSEGIVRGFREKGNPAAAGSTAGHTYSDPSCAIACLSAARSPSSRSCSRPRFKSIRPLAFPTTGLFIDIGIPEDYARAQEIFFPRVTR